MSDESMLHEKAREALRAGILPNRRPDNTWGGPGNGIDCTICGQAMTANDLEIEIEFVGSHDDPCQGVYRVHPRCFSIWETERRNLGRDGEPASLDPAQAAARPSLGSVSD